MSVVSRVDVVDDSGVTTEICNLTGRPEAGWRLPIQLDPPTGAVAAMINLAVTEPGRPGYLTLEDCLPRSGARQTAAITFTGGQTISTLAVVPVSQDGRFCVYRSTDVHSIVDVVAYLGSAGEPLGVDPQATEPANGQPADGEPLWFEPSTPTRITDTRQQGSCTPLLECHEGRIPAGGRHLVPTSTTHARIANLAVVDANGPGYGQAGRCDALGAERDFSNINYADHTARSNLVVIEGGDTGTCVFTLTDAHVVVDELGRLTADTGYGWSLAAPHRVLDTRECSSTWCDQRPGAGTLIALDLGIDSPAAAVAITVTEPQAPGYVTVGRCDVLAAADRPATSNLNHGAGQTITNLALVDLDEGEMCIYTSASAHVIIDVQAELVADQQIGLFPIAPERAHDSRLDHG